MRRWGAVIALAVLGLTASLATPARAATAARPMLLIAIPDLRWSDLPNVPVLDSFGGFAAVGVLSVRAEGEVTRCGDGLLELSAGTRVATGVRTCALDPTQLAVVRDRYRHNRFGARVGTLADLLPGPLEAVGPAATMLLTNSHGQQPEQVASVGDAFATNATAVGAVVDDELYGATDRRAAAAKLNSTILQQFRQVPQSAAVAIVGVSDGASGGAHLHPLFLASPGDFAHRELTSPTTGRAPFVQLVDVTATLLAMRGVTQLPSSVSGRDVRVTGRVVPHFSTYADMDLHARRSLHVGHPTMTTLCAVLLGVLLLVVAGRREAVWPARLLVLAPLAPSLLQVVPWWRWGTGAYVAGVAIVAVVGAVLVTFLARSWPRLALVAGPVLTAAVLLTDQVAGAPLQLAAPLGDNPLIAGRFHGMGNIDFGLTMAAILLIGAVAGLSSRGRRAGAAVAATLCLLALAIDGLPSVGDDIGGVVAFLPAAALLVALVARLRVTVARLVAVVVAAVLAGVGVAFLDYARPAAHQTHAGRFIGQVLHGGAAQVVHRKADAVLASFVNPVVTLTVVVAVVAAIVVHRRYATPPPIAAAAVAVALLALTGTVLNDSGVFVAAAAVLAFAAPVLAGALPAGADGDTG